MRPSKSSKQPKQKSPIPMNYVLIAGAVGIAIVAVISIVLTANSRSSSGAVDETEAQSRWKDTVVPTRKK